jgi:hypothetical protein
VKLIVPTFGELQPLESRLLRLAHFLGIDCATLPLESVSRETLSFHDQLPDSSDCLAVSPQVLEDWLGPHPPFDPLTALFFSRFTQVIVHGLHPHPFHSCLVAALSGGELRGVTALEGRGASYQFASDCPALCEAFSGLKFGPADQANDSVLCLGGEDAGVRPVISIDGHPFMAAVRVGQTDVLFISSAEVADVDAEVGDAPLTTFFSRFVPQAMALRWAAGKACWRPNGAHAAIVIDDPLLQPRYGFLNFDALLELATQHDFHAALAFIPHNYRRTSARVAGLFRDHPQRLSICYHGNDHLQAEFSSADPLLLHAMLFAAESRMSAHRKTTGLVCDRVMVFPQGNFSVEAMQALGSHNFHAAVNTVPYPRKQPAQLTLAELAQPAVLRYGYFPLFLRKPICQTQRQDMAFNLFFGRPILAVEHHEVFRHPASLADFAASVRTLAPGLRWSNLDGVVRQSFLTRPACDGAVEVRAYSRAITLCNRSDANLRYLVRWEGAAACAPIQHLLVDGAAEFNFTIEADAVLFSTELAPGVSRSYSLLCAPFPSSPLVFTWRHQAKAFLRRRLSEFRDNRLARNPRLLAAARFMQRRIFNLR